MARKIAAKKGRRQPQSLSELFGVSSPIHPAQFGVILWEVAEAVERNPDAIMQSVGHLLYSVGALLCGYDPRRGIWNCFADYLAGTPEACERKLRAILEASERAGAVIGVGDPGHGIPDPDNIVWCARRARVAMKNAFTEIPARNGYPAEPSIPDDAEAIADALEKGWVAFTTRACPVTGVPLRAAVRDLLAKLDDTWATLSPSEKARQVVMACLRKAGVRKPKPSAFFDDERQNQRRKAEGLGRTIMAVVRPSGGRQP